MVFVPNVTPPQSPAQRFLSQEPLEQTPQQKCEKDGGTWINGKCVRNVKERVAAQNEAKAKAEAETKPTIKAPGALETFTSS